MHKNQIGTVEVISFRTTRRDAVYAEPIEGSLTGTSISHIALRVTFTDKALFDTYVAGNQNIHYDELVDAETGKAVYVAYFSFWPTVDQTLLSSKSRLCTHQHDSEQSALGSPMTYASRFAAYSPTKEAVAAPIPIVQDILHAKIRPYPALMVHITRLEGLINHKLKDQSPESRKAVIDKIVAITKTYGELYDAWFDAQIKQHNATFSLLTTPLKTAFLAKRTQQAHAQLLAFSEQMKHNIRNEIFAGQDVSDDTFIDQLEDYMTFGRPELDSITLPLVHKSINAKQCGLEIEPLLQFIKDVANNPDKYKYDLIEENCATMVIKALTIAARACSSKQLQHAFELPWYVRLLRMPVSPAMVMKLTAAAAAHSDMITATLLNTVEPDTAIAMPSSTTTRRKTVTQLPQSPVMLPQFSNKPAANTEAEVQRVAERLTRG